MKIFFTFSSKGLKEFEQEYKNILNELKSENIVVVDTYNKNYLEEKPYLQKIENLNLSENTYRYAHDSAIRKAIIQCDAVIIEASCPSFRVGFEAFFSLSQQKPVLVLSKFNNYGRLIDQPHFFGAKYTDVSLSDEISKFIKQVNEFKLRNRFNLFISDNQKDYLEKEAKRNGISMSDYVRNLIDHDENR